MNIVYIYTRTGTSPIMQIFDTLNISITSKLSEIGRAEFDIPVVKKDGSIHEALQDISILQKMNRVKIGFLREWVETIVFDGYITNINDSALSTHVICSDRMMLLEQRMLLADTPYNTGLSSILSNLFSVMNGIENTGLSVSSTITTTTTKDYSAGQKIFDILKDLSNGWYQFGISWDTVYLDTFIWVDRSTWSDRVEFIYVYNQARARTIEDFSFSSDVRNIKNAIYGKNTGGSVLSSTDSTSISAYGRQEEFISVNGDVTSETSKYLAEHKDDTIEISISPSSRDFSLANVGDKVWVYIDRGDVRGKYEGALVVQSKEYIDGDLPEIKYGFSTSKIRTPTILEKIKMMANDIQVIKNI